MYLVFKGSIYKVLMWIHSWISSSVHEVWQMNVLILDNKWGSQHPLGIPVRSPNITWESHLGVPTSLGNPTYPFLKLVPGVPDMWDSQHYLGIPLGSPNFIWESQVSFGNPSIFWESHLGVPTLSGIPNWDSQWGLPLGLGPP